MSESLKANSDLKVWTFVQPAHRQNQGGTECRIYCKHRVGKHGISGASTH